MNKRITILGCGLIGKTIAADLCRDFEVTSVDNNSERLNQLKESFPAKILLTDLSNGLNVQSAINSADLVICAVPGFMGFQTLKTIIDAGKNVVDISFFGEDPFLLDDLARKNNVTAVVDCGIAPGLSCLILGYHNKKMKVDSYECYVGGLPLYPKEPFKYKAPFSPTDVIEEYTRPARMVENGKIVIKEALSGSEIIEFEKAGKLEAFYTDGLRTLLKTMKIPDMKEKTLRYPGHIKIIKLLKEIGFFSNEEVEVGGDKIKPIKLTSKILFPHWKLETNEEEFTVLRVIIRGEGKAIQYDIYDEFDVETKTTSMARTTGYTCTAAARLLLADKFNRKGICPPEYLGDEDGCFEEVISCLKKHKIDIKKKEKA